MERTSISDYDPGGPGKKGALFGLPYHLDDARCVIMPIPWDVTASYGHGTAKGPEAILNASPQLDLELPSIEDAWKLGIWMEPIDPTVEDESTLLRAEVISYLEALESGQVTGIDEFASTIKRVNTASLELQKTVCQQARTYLDRNQIVGLLGGDHSCPLGLIQALGERYSNLGILQIDAHMDLRRSYEGFDQSHASIMYNALRIPGVNKLVQVGIRDYSREEVQLSKKDDRVHVFYDERLKERHFCGENWANIVEEIVQKLPDHVYISFDIDGLDPKLCPGTGTPVPGGLDFTQAIYLIKQVALSGRIIVGFDLCEVAPQELDREWNGNVGARVLYNLACWCGVSNKWLEATK